VITALDVEPGQRVADIGAGTGVFTRPLASAVGADGIVYAIDVNPELLRHIEETAAKSGFENIRIILAAGDDPQIPESVDLIFICDTLHHIDERADYLKGLRVYLRPGGRIAVIDFDGASPHIFPSLKYPRRALMSWMEGAGYRFVRSFDFVVDNFFMIYECESCPESP
jgi:ubiquinone/menaquinone biosynthesis C-methylase UbiE